MQTPTRNMLSLEDCLDVLEKNRCHSTEGGRESPRAIKNITIPHIDQYHQLHDAYMFF